MATTGRSDTAPKHTPRVVVGVDRSDGSRDALRAAYEEARMRHATLEVVYAWERPYRWAEGFNAAYAEDLKVFTKLAEQHAEDMVDELLAGARRPHSVDVVAIEGYPSAVLLERAADADLLVVGSRGRGGFGSLLLGSVSTACVHHATCAVLVVRPPRDEQA
jgi:nucleotide-binding universal stress UspA family protein